MTFPMKFYVYHKPTWKTFEIPEFLFQLNHNITNIPKTNLYFLKSCLTFLEKLMDSNYSYCISFYLDVHIEPAVCP